MLSKVLLFSVRADDAVCCNQLPGGTSATEASLLSSHSQSAHTRMRCLFGLSVPPSQNHVPSSTFSSGSGQRQSVGSTAGMARGNRETSSSAAGGGARSLGPSVELKKAYKKAKKKQKQLSEALVSSTVLCCCCCFLRLFLLCCFSLCLVPCARGS